MTRNHIYKETIDNAPSFDNVKTINENIPEQYDYSIKPRVFTDLHNNALARVKRGELFMVNRLAIDPAKCRIWSHCPRLQSHLSPESCADLIESIRTFGKQAIPAVVRPISDGSPHEYEVICGSRRHFSVTWLRLNGMPNLLFEADVYQLSDYQAFRLSDSDNRARR